MTIYKVGGRWAFPKIGGRQAICKRQVADSGGLCAGQMAAWLSVKQAEESVNH
ncbi:MAG: hypothetical protein JW705_02630 [Methanosarcinaceae archaeon]|nr:hypothetical protein [Methanosarcinaceae archaeon]